MALAIPKQREFPKIDDVVYKAVNDAVNGDKNTEIPLEYLFKTLSQYNEQEIETSVHSLASARKLMYTVFSKRGKSISTTVQLIEE